MIGFNSATTSIMDAYSVIQEKKNDVVASTIANKRANKNRANATVIGAGAGLINAAALTTLYKFSQAFPALRRNPLINWTCAKFDKWIRRATNIFPSASKSLQGILGIAGKAGYGMLLGAITGFSLNIINGYLKTRTNSNISGFKQGYLKDSWLLAGAESLTETKKGKEILKDAIQKTDKGVLVKFKGVNRQYEVTKKEIKQAYKEYVTLFDGDKVKGYRKNYASGDGDIIALEIAFRKYQSDLREGRIMANKFLPQYANHFSSDNTLSETDASQFYYLLTGKETTKLTSESDDSAKDDFFNKYVENSSNIAACFKLKKEAEDGKTALKSTFGKVIVLNAEKTYAIKGVYGKYVKIVDTRNSLIEKTVSIDSLKRKFDEITYVNI